MTLGLAHPRAQRVRLVLAAAAVLLAAADTYVVVAVLPSIMDGVGLTLDRLQRATPIITGFLLGYTAVLPLIGRLADLAGPERVFQGCVAIFAGGSLVTATSHSLPVVVVGRGLQGVGGGGLVPVTLAMVAARWSPDERGLPLGVVGAVQELGSVLGPLYGAGISALASWRAIFWINLPLAAVLMAGFAFVGTAERRNARTGVGSTPDSEKGAETKGFDLVGAVLALVGSAGLVVGLDAPAALAGSASLGSLYSPHAAGQWAPFTTDAVMLSLAVLTSCVLWELTLARRTARPLVDLRRLLVLLRRCDVPGAVALGGVLACVVVIFSSADPAHQVVASSTPVVAPLAGLLAGVFLWRQRSAASPLIRPGALRTTPAWGSLLVNLALGGALMAALVDVPLFALATVTNSELSAALVLVRFLVAVPVGALVGGALCKSRARARPVATAGMALAAACFVGMANWTTAALGKGMGVSDLELVGAGLGFGLAVAPVNVAILAAVDEDLHALASALAVVARTVGMLAGLSALTALALRRFYESQASIPSPLKLCPASPTNCPPYQAATTRAVIVELHTIFAGASVLCLLAAVLAAALLGQGGRRLGPRLDRASLSPAS
jgi:MFS family permease